MGRGFSGWCVLVEGPSRCRPLTHLVTSVRIIGIVPTTTYDIRRRCDLGVKKMSAEWTRMEENEQRKAQLVMHVARKDHRINVTDSKNGKYHQSNEIKEEILTSCWYGTGMGASNLLIL
jgi:hypothetical protein